MHPIAILEVVVIVHDAEKQMHLELFYEINCSYCQSTKEMSDKLLTFAAKERTRPRSHDRPTSGSNLLREKDSRFRIAGQLCKCYADTRKKMSHVGWNVAMRVHYCSPHEITAYLRYGDFRYRANNQVKSDRQHTVVCRRIAWNQSQNIIQKFELIARTQYIVYSVQYRFDTVDCLQLLLLNPNRTPYFYSRQHSTLQPDLTTLKRQ